MNIMNGSTATADTPLRRAKLSVSLIIGRARHSHPSRTVSSTRRALVAPRACLAWRLSDFVTNRHEQCR